jgi:hypothetical protein
MCTRPRAYVHASPEWELKRSVCAGTCVRVHMRLCACTCVFARAHAYVHVHMHTRAQAYVRVHKRMTAFTCVCARAQAYMRVYMCMCACTCVRARARARRVAPTRSVWQTCALHADSDQFSDSPLSPCTARSPCKSAGGDWSPGGPPFIVRRSESGGSAWQTCAVCALRGLAAANEPATDGASSGMTAEGRGVAQRERELLSVACSREVIHDLNLSRLNP